MRLQKILCLLFRGPAEIEGVSVRGLPRAYPLIEGQLKGRALPLENEGSPMWGGVIKIDAHLVRAPQQKLPEHAQPIRLRGPVMLHLPRGSNRAVSRCAMLWQAVEALRGDETAAASGRVEVVDQIDKTTGVAYRALRLYGVRPIAKGWATLPTLHLDATASIELIRARVPHAKLRVDIVADEPHVRVI
jgi:hypothetical protein